MNQNDIHLYGWVYECPLKDMDFTCQMKVVEHVTYHEKVSWIDGLYEKEKETITKHHFA